LSYFRIRASVLTIASLEVIAFFSQEYR